MKCTAGGGGDGDWEAESGFHDTSRNVLKAKDGMVGGLQHYAECCRERRNAAGFATTFRGMSAGLFAAEGGGNAPRAEAGRVAGSAGSGLAHGVGHLAPVRRGW